MSKTARGNISRIQRDKYRLVLIFEQNRLIAACIFVGYGSDNEVVLVADVKLTC